MTYGWAILIIAVVLGVLFQLGVFSGSALTPKAQPGSCQVQRLLGQVSLEGLCQGQLPQSVAFFSGFPYININSNMQVPNGFTATAWYESNNGGQFGGTGTIFSFSTTGTNQIDIGTTSSSSISGVIYTSSGSSTITITPSYSPSNGAWHFVAFTYNNVVATFYFDTLSSSSGVSYTFPTVAQEVIGAGEGQGFGIFGGAISNVQLYNASMSANEIKGLYYEGVGGAPVRIQNIIGWWPLNSNFNDYSAYSTNSLGVPTSSKLTFNTTWQSSYTPP